jgi:CRISPR system Cascade subunit CasC
LRQAAVQRLADEIARMDAAYGAPLARRYLAVDDVTVPGAQRLPLNALADWAHTAVVQASVEV